jgi:hypothetical protein
MQHGTLTSTEELSVGHAKGGLRELTEDISMLLNLKSLHLRGNPNISYIPESISCLLKLEHFSIDISDISELPAGLGKLENLMTLSVSYIHTTLGVPNLEVTRLKSRGQTDCSL